MPSSTDCIQRQNKLEEFGVKYICTVEVGGISLQQDTVTVGVNLNGRSICTIVLLIASYSVYNHHVVHDFVFGGTYCCTVLWYKYCIPRCCFQRMHTLQPVYIISHTTSYTSVSLFS